MLLNFPLHSYKFPRRLTYGCYIAVEPDSGDYFIDADIEVASHKARDKHPNAVHCMFCLNETGATGTI